MKTPIINRFSNRGWFKYENYHREDGAAIISADGTQEWLKNGRRHREDGPAVIWSNGRQDWWKNGKPLLNPKSWTFPS